MNTINKDDVLAMVVEVSELREATATAERDLKYWIMDNIEKAQNMGLIKIDISTANLNRMRRVI